MAKKVFNFQREGYSVASRGVRLPRLGGYGSRADSAEAFPDWVRCGGSDQVLLIRVNCGYLRLSWDKKMNSGARSQNPEEGRGEVVGWFPLLTNVNGSQWELTGVKKYAEFSVSSFQFSEGWEISLPRLGGCEGERTIEHGTGGGTPPEPAAGTAALQRQLV